MLRQRFEGALYNRFRWLKGLINTSIVTNDCFGLNITNRGTNPDYFSLVVNAVGTIDKERFAFERDPKKVQLFMDWIREQIELGILEIYIGEQIGQAVEHAWTNMYIQTAYQRGMVRGQQELSNKGYQVPTFDDMPGGITAAFNRPFHLDKVGLVYTRTFEGLKGITDEMSKQISSTLAQGIADGKGPLELARQINDRVDKIGITRARILARTEIVRAHHVATVQMYENWGVVGVSVMAEWITAEDGRVCPDCAAMARKNKGYGKGVYTLDQIRGLIPLHPQCVTGDSIIVSPDVKYLMDSVYSGPIVKISLSNGTDLSVTSNHMLFTPKGLVMARFLSKSDYLLNSTLLERVIFSNPDYNRDDIRIDNIVKSFSKSGGCSARRMPMSPEYFHGDAIFCKEDINIIDATRFLKDGINTSFIEHFINQNFSSGSVLDVFKSFGNFAHVFKSVFSSSNSFVGFSREFLAFFNGCLIHSKKHGVASISCGNSIIFKRSDYDRATNHEFFSKFFNRSSIIEISDHFVMINIDSIMNNIFSERKSSINKSFFDSISFFEINRISNAFESFASHVTPVQIINVSSYHVDDLPVYDVSTMSTIYNVNGVLSSNCRCVAIPLDITDNEELQQKIKEVA